MFAAIAVLQLFCVAASIVAYRSRSHALIASDGKSYYVWLRSLALDHDLDFGNDYLLVYPPDPLPTELYRFTTRGLPSNKYPVGLALVETPGFVVGHAVAWLAGQPLDGVSAPYQFAVVTWLQLLCMAGLWMLWLALVRLRCDGIVACWLALSCVAATNLMQYVARPAMPHGPGFAILCFALYAAVCIWRGEWTTPWAFAFLGALLGLAVSVRLTNAAVGLFFIPFVLPSLQRLPRRSVVLLAALVAVLAIHVTITSILWGRLTLSGYTEEGFTSGIHGVGQTLLSARHGLFIYHPWYVGAFAVSLLALREAAIRRFAAAGLAAFAALAIANGTWWCWWFGDSFGNRAFIEVIVPLATVVAMYLSAKPLTRAHYRAFGAATALLVAGNAVLWTGYVLRRYPPDGRHSVADAYFWAWRSP